MTKIEVAEVVAMLMAAYPQARFAEQTSAVYETLLRDLDHKLVQRACMSIIASSRFMPTIAEIRETCVNLKFGRKRPGGDAWGDVTRAIKRYGRDRVPGIDFEFDDPLTGHAVTALGWSELCSSDNAVADRARFIELYDGLDMNERCEAQVSTGITKRKRIRERGTKTLRDLVSGMPMLPKGSA